MKIEAYDLPLMLSQMTMIAAKEQEMLQRHAQLQAMKDALADFIRAHYKVEVNDGTWELDPEKGELVEL